MMTSSQITRPFGDSPLASSSSLSDAFTASADDVSVGVNADVAVCLVK